MNRAFLDANALFSAAYGSPGLRTLWELARARRHELLASAHVIEEARRNLIQKHHATLQELVGRLTIVPSPPPVLTSPIELPPGDREAFVAAVASGSSHFLTGDLRHFGSYVGKRVAGVRIQTPAGYLEGFRTRSDQ